MHPTSSVSARYLNLRDFKTFYKSGEMGIELCIRFQWLRSHRISLGLLTNETCNWAKECCAIVNFSETTSKCFISLFSCRKDTQVLSLMRRTRGGAGGGGSKWDLPIACCGRPVLSFQLHFSELFGLFS